VYFRWGGKLLRNQKTEPSTKGVVSETLGKEKFKKRGSSMLVDGIRREGAKDTPGHSLRKPPADCGERGSGTPLVKRLGLQKRKRLLNIRFNIF